MRPQSKKSMESNRTEFKALYEYLTASDHYAGFSSNFSTAVSVISRLNNPESIYMPTVKQSSSSDWPYHFSQFVHMEHINTMRNARRAIMNMSKDDRQFLMFGFYNSPGKFTADFRRSNSMMYLDQNVDLSACFCLEGNLTPKESELLRVQKKEKYNTLLIQTKMRFISLINLYVVEYRRIENEEKKVAL